MRFGRSGFGLLVLALSLAATAPASAELFTCHQRPGQVLYSYNGSPGQYGSRSYTSSPRYSSSYAAQPSRRSYQTHATYFNARHYWNDRLRW